MMRYRNSKICKGRIAPGKRTKGRGKSGSSTTSLDFGGFVWCFSEKEEAEQRREVGFPRRKVWREVGLGERNCKGFKGERMLLFLLLGFKVGLCEGMS